MWSITWLQRCQQVWRWYYSFTSPDLLCHVTRTACTQRLSSSSSSSGKHCHVISRSGFTNGQRSAALVTRHVHVECLLTEALTCYSHARPPTESPTTTHASIVYSCWRPAKTSVSCSVTLVHSTVRHRLLRCRCVAPASMIDKTVRQRWPWIESIHGLDSVGLGWVPNFQILLGLVEINNFTIFLLQTLLRFLYLRIENIQLLM